MKSPLFSIVTVCLNPGEALTRTVNSVLTQDFDNFEYVIKDGLSHDGTSYLVHSDSRVKLVSQQDSGIYDAMNQALSICSGQYVNFLNAGDSFRINHALYSVAGCLKSKKYPDLIYTDRNNEKLKAISNYPPSLTSWFLFRKPVCHQAVFVKRDILVRIGGFDTSYQLFADYDALVKLVLMNKIRNIHCPVVAVNYEDGGISYHNPLVRKHEHQRIRKTYFSRLQRFIFGLAYGSTLPGIRIPLVYQERIPWLRKFLLTLTNHQTRNE
jgi:glycosyltransferase involved in cell wall biosynthesis